ncbi:diphthine methyltransferase-like [Pecten maximus]|uniref:diphthine methyltransferase-like n=1 Tax=Pecten maximus TaxID=6579 RepID=UPI001458DA57|nr:diphthine methyltransferase-like [Pecten maximus]XP_033755350.1 diphthine methyltransferase-like [Pecten maximus]
MATFITNQTLDTEFSADSTEWCPHGNHLDILLCGTYQLDTSNSESKTSDDDGTALQRRQTRHGRLYVHRLTDGQQLTTETTLDMPGILDIKWCPTPCPEGSLMALVNSVGQLRLYSMTDSETGAPDQKVQMTEVMTFDLGDDCLGLSLDWSNRANKGSPTHICSSTSTGDIHTHAVDGGDLRSLTTWKGHDFEAWITAYNYWDTNLIYTGGDDSKLKGWDLRIDPKQPVFVNKRHTMGVTSIQSCPNREHLLCTGSYDEDLMVWDTRKMRSPLVTTPLGGGIWRVKWEPMYGQHILTATMYNGFHIVDASNLTEEPLPILCHYDKHTSLAYGADWCYMDPSSGSHQASGEDQLDKRTFLSPQGLQKMNKENRQLKIL